MPSELKGPKRMRIGDDSSVKMCMSIVTTREEGI